MHAAVDTLLSKIVEGKNMKVYTFGQPRVGNKAFEDILTKSVPETFRIVHHADIVAQVPPCINTGSECQISGSIPYYPYHSLTEVMYDLDFKTHKVCTILEDVNCSRQYGPLYSFSDHTFYFGINVGAHWTKAAEVIEVSN